MGLPAAAWIACSNDMVESTRRLIARIHHSAAESYAAVDASRRQVVATQQFLSRCARRATDAHTDGFRSPVSVPHQHTSFEPSSTRREACGWHHPGSPLNGAGTTDKSAPVTSGRRTSLRLSCFLTHRTVTL